MSQLHMTEKEIILMHLTDAADSLEFRGHSVGTAEKLLLLDIYRDLLPVVSSNPANDLEANVRDAFLHSVDLYLAMYQNSKTTS